MNKSNRKTETMNVIPTLSLCMIVKDEERFLGQCLESVKDLVYEMVIVDTGSSDRTVEIAESYGAKIAHHAWNGSFSEARNYGLQFATGDWILQLDADEKLEKEDVPLLGKLIKAGGYDVLFVKILNESKEGWTVHFHQRLFRRGRACYDGIVHNQLKYGGPDLVTEIRIYHYGYNLSREMMAAKHRRTEALLVKQLDEDSTNPFYYQNYVRILRALRKFDEGARAGRKAMTVCKDRMFDYHLQMIAFDTANCLMGLDQAEEAEMLCRKILKAHPENMDILFVLGSALNKRKRYREALVTYQKYLEINNERVKLNPHLIYDTYDFTHKAWALISNCYFEIGDLENAQTAAEKAVTLRPDIAIYKIPLARLYVENQWIEKARKLLNDVHENQRADVEFYKKWAKFCVKYPFMGSPTEKLKLGLDRYPESDDLYNELAYACYPTDIDTAEENWKRVIEISPDHIGAHVGLTRLYAKMGKTNQLETHARVILQKCEKNSLLKEVGRSCLRMQLYSGAVDLLSKYLTMETEDVDALADIATCYAEMGRFQAAFLGYKEALRFSPHNVTIIEKLKKLQNNIKQIRLPVET